MVILHAHLATLPRRLKRCVKIGGEMVSLPATDLFSIRALDRAQVNRVIQDAGLSGLNNIRIVRDIARIPVLGTGKTDYRTLIQSLADRLTAATT